MNSCVISKALRSVEARATVGAELSHEMILWGVGVRVVAPSLGVGVRVVGVGVLSLEVRSGLWGSG